MQNWAEMETEYQQLQEECQELTSVLQQRDLQLCDLDQQLRDLAARMKVCHCSQLSACALYHERSQTSCGFEATSNANCSNAALPSTRGPSLQSLGCSMKSIALDAQCGCVTWNCSSGICTSSASARSHAFAKVEASAKWTMWAIAKYM